MSTAKFEKLIDLIINEDQERAEQLFHEIVVEKSREIYENLMELEDGDLDETMTGDLMQEIEAEEQADLTMEDEMEEGYPTMEDEMEDEEVTGDFDVEGGEEFDDAGADMGSADAATKDDIMDLEDKLDQLLAAFEEEFGDSDEEEVEMDDEEVAADDAADDDSDEEVMEAVEMKKVSVTHNDGSDSGSRKGPLAANSGQAGMAARPVKFSDGGEGQPTAPKGPSNAYSKGQGEVKGAGSFKNSPGAKVETEAAPKPVTKQASGVNVKDVVPESKRTNKRMI
jgi:hypothetical protein